MAEPTETQAEEGFALVEVLVGLALMSILVLLLFQGVSSAARMSRTIAATERQEGVRAVREHLRRVIGDAVAEIGPGRDAVFAGRHDALVLVTGGERMVEFGGQMRVGLALAPSADGTDLVEMRGLDRGGWAEPGAPEPILRNVVGLRLRYYGRHGATPQLSWGETWPSAGRLPVLVSVAVSFPRGDMRRWAPLILPVAAGR